MSPRRAGFTAVLGVAALLAEPTEARALWPYPAGDIAYGDFDGDGTLETVVSSPELDCGKGAVYVVAEGSVETWTRDTTGILGTATCDDFFGAAIAVGDFDNDTYDDLAVGAPGADDSGTSNAGAVHIIYGSSTGLTATGDEIWHQDSTGIAGVAESEDDFGSVLTTGDFDCDDYDDVVISVPTEEVGGDDEAGAVHVLYGGSGGITTVDDLYKQGVGGVNGTSEEGDHFGASVVAGNFNGDADGGNPCMDLVIGIPDEEVQGADKAGKLYGLYGGVTGLSTTGDFAASQRTAGVEGDEEIGDRFTARLSITDTTGDGYDDLVVIVPGDGCTPAISVGKQTFAGSSSGLDLTDDVLVCTDYDCLEVDNDEYVCGLRSPPIYGASGNDEIRALIGDDVVWGEGGADILRGNHGDDVLFGGDGADELDGGPGMDVQIGGEGNDTFVIDADCEVVDGEVIDGGPGTDVIESHLSQSALEALGLTIVSIETFTTISEHPDGDDHCSLPPFEEGPGTVPVVTMAWDDLPNEDSEFTTSDGELDLTLTNTSGGSVDVDITFTLYVRGETVEVNETFTMSTTYALTLDLDDFVPSGIDKNAGDPTLHASAWISTHGTVESGGVVIDDTHAPALFGHIDTTNSEAVLYREEAMHDSYNDGFLGHVGKTENPWPGSDMGPPVEGRGSVCVPSE